ncbi:MAG TPA: hypothetical protein VI456_15745 [Polyangia bacterium]
MASKKPTEVAPLVSAAQAFSETLQGFTAAAQAVGRAPLNSSEGLARAAEALRRVVTSEEELQARAQALIAALAQARQAQEAHAEQVKTRAFEVERRGEEYGALVRRFEAIGRDAVDLNATAQQLAAENKIDPGMRSEEISPILARLAEIDERMTAVALSSETLAADARAADFDELNRKSDSLRQQLLAAQNRIGLLRDALTKAIPRTFGS